jgi:hypothetical protein
MKRTAILFLASIGAVTLALLAFKLVTPVISYEEMIRRHFGSPEAIRELGVLYDRVEKSGESLAPAGARVRDIPRDWMPEKFSFEWGTLYYRGEASRVVAHFDDHGGLVAIEFDGSRCGCYVSRDAARCPRQFRTLQRLSDGPLYVTGRVGSFIEAR